MLRNLEKIKGKSQYDVKKLVLSTGILLFLSLFFSVQIANVYLNSPTSNYESCEVDELEFSKPTDEISSTHGNWGHPFENDSNETEPPEENESNESSDDDDDLDDWNPLSKIPEFDPLSSIPLFKVSKSSILSYNASFHNRKLVPLFILQHSWKSFLS